MESGFIYILSNDLYSKKILKIGKTTRNTYVRNKELSSATGIPNDFTIEYSEWVKDVHLCELKIHKELDQYRVGKKEFFELSLSRAKKVARSICDQINKTTISDDTGKEKDHEILKVLHFVGESDSNFTYDMFLKMCSWEKSVSDERLKMAISFRIGEYLLKRDDAENALEKLKDIGKNNMSLQLFGIDENEIWVNKAECYLKLKKYRQAAYCFQFISDKFMSKIRRAELFLKLKDFDKSLALYKELASQEDDAFHNLIEDRISLIQILKRNSI